MKTAKQIFDFLPGVWKITRAIILFPETLHYPIKSTGVANFVLSQSNPNIILYSEKISISESTIGTQLYQYKYDEITSSISKYFSDNTLFYTLKISEHKIEGKHLCIEDHYRSKYVFGDNKFVLTYFVQGPSKNYKIITEYTKISPK